MDTGDNNMLRIGDKVDLFLGRGPTYRTLLEDITDEGRLVISPPLHRGIPIVLRKEQKIEVYFYRDNGRFCIDAGVHDFSISNNVRLIILDVLSQPRKQQRRDSYRLSIDRDILMLREQDGPFPFRDSDKIDESLLIRATSENISEKGMAIKTRAEFFRDDKAWAKINLKWPAETSPPMVVHCKIVQAQYDRVKAIYSYGIQFIDYAEDDRVFMAKFILTEQQKVIKWQRLLMEE